MKKYITPFIYLELVSLCVVFELYKFKISRFLHFSVPLGAELVLGWFSIFMGGLYFLIAISSIVYIVATFRKVKLHSFLPLLFVLLGLIAFLIVSYYSNLTLFTGNHTNITSIEITPHMGNTILIDDQEQILQIVNELSNTPLQAKFFPDHVESKQTDNEYIIKIQYNNGQYSDTIALSIEGKNVYRFLHTRGSSGDSGYVHGQNEKVYFVIQNIISSK